MNNAIHEGLATIQTVSAYGHGGDAIEEQKMAKKSAQLNVRMSVNELDASRPVSRQLGIRVSTCIRQAVTAYAVVVDSDKASAD